MSEHIHLYAEFEALPDERESVAELLSAYGRRVRQELGNLRFESYTLRDRPDRFFVVEEYSSTEAFELHIGAPYGAAFNARLSPLVVGGGSQLTWLTPIA